MFRHGLLCESELAQRFSGHHFGGKLCQRDADCLAHKRNGARRARVNFKNINIRAFHRELYIHQAAHVQFARHRFRRRRNFIEHFLRQRECRNHARTVATVNTRFLDVLHNRSDHRGFAVGDAIDIDLDRVFEKAVNQNRAIRRYFNCTGYVTPKIFLVIDKLHGASTEHERRSHQDRITNFVCDCDSSICVDRGAAWSLPQAKLVEHGGEQLSIFRGLDALGLCSKNRNASGLQTVGEIERSLSTELHKHALRFFLIVNVENVLESERLKIKFVARVVIGGNRLRIRIDHDCFKSELPQREGSVDTAVIELNSLTNSIRPAAQDHYLVLVALAPLVLVAVG